MSLICDRQGRTPHASSREQTLILGLVAPLMAGPPSNFGSEIRNGKPVYIESNHEHCPSTFKGMFTTA
jgi:hypothetical protein